MISRILVLVGLVVSSACHAASALQVADDAVVIEGVIQGNNLQPVATELLRRAAEGVQSTDIVINSPGGSVTTGFMFLSQMDEARARGMKLRCFVPEIAASMAFGILVHCDERHALARSFLLWHRARVSVGGFGGAPMTAPQAAVLARDLDAVDKLIFEETNAALGMPEEDVRYHFENETLHVGSNLHRMAPNFITSHARIEGLYEALENQKLVRSKQPNIFGLQFRMGEIIYISDKFTATTGN